MTICMPDMWYANPPSIFGFRIRDTANGSKCILGANLPNWAEKMSRQTFSGDTLVDYESQVVCAREVIGLLSSLPSIIAAQFSSTMMELPQYRGKTVEVSIINSATCQMAAGLMVDPPGTQEFIGMANFCFLVRSESQNSSVLFDLGFMGNVIERAPPVMKPLVSPESGLLKIDEMDVVSDVLRGNDIPLETISAVILSHSHLDHVGDPSVFPESTTIVVGEGFTKGWWPGYPEDANSSVLSSCFAKHTIEEIDWEKKPLKVGGFRAVDYFEDGSMYLLETSGHTNHHISALFRTTPDSWIFAAGDACHHVGQLRPNKHHHLPSDCHPNSTPLAKADCCCNGSDSPTFRITRGMQEDVDRANDTLSKLMEFDGAENVFIVLAHDISLLGTIRLFPEKANEWKGLGWDEQCRWKFLDF